MNDDQQPMTVHDYLADLTRPHMHAEPVTQTYGLTTVTTRHRTKVPPLLVQLESVDWTDSGSTRSGTGFESRPAVPLEALQALVAIDIEAARWVRDLGEDDPGDTLECVRLLNGLVASASWCGRAGARRDETTKQVTCCTRHAIEADARRWWTRARIVTGWDTPAWRPDNTCPECSVRGSLRIRLEQRSGLCVECETTWGAEDYQVLADHVRRESAEARRAAKPAPCSCAWPRAVHDLGAMCPRCGSATCVNAVRALGKRRVAG